MIRPLRDLRYRLAMAADRALLDTLRFCIRHSGEVTPMAQRGMDLGLAAVEFHMAMLRAWERDR